MTAARPRPARPRPSRRAPARLLAIVAATALAATTALVAVPASAEPEASGDGWTVERVGEGYEVTVELDAPLEIRAAAPSVVVDGEEVGVAVVSPDGTSLTAVTEDPAVLQADDVEAGWSGESRTADVVTPASIVAPDAAPSATAFPTDPAAPGGYEVATLTYDLGDAAVALRDIGGVRGELAARVDYPLDAVGERPVVVVLHGRGAACRTAAGVELIRFPCRSGETEIPALDGFASLGRTLASQGYAVVSISAHAISANDDVRATDRGAAARGGLVLDHLALLDQANRGVGPAEVPADLLGRLDLDRVGLLGHSRGGEGVVRAAQLAAAEGRGTIDSVMLLAPSDMGRLTLPDVPTFTVLPYCDGDLASLPGAQYLDDSRHAFDDDVLRSTALVMGANHNGFNTVWTSDDWTRPIATGAPSDPRDPTCDAAAPASQRLTTGPTGEQAQVRDAYAAAWFRLTLGGETDFLPLVDGSGAVPQALLTAGVEVSTTASAPASARRDVATFTADNPAVTVLPGASAAVCASMDGRPVAPALPPCALRSEVDEAQVPHWAPALNAPSAPNGRVLDLRWTTAGSGVSVALAPGSRDVSGFTALSLRAAPAPRSTTAPQLRLQVVDGAGGAATVAVGDVSDALTPLPGAATPLRRTLLRGVQVPLTQLTGVDLTDVATIRLLGDDAAGRVLLSDLAFTRSALGAPTGVVRPALTVTDTEVREGNGPGIALVALRLSTASAAPVTASVETVRPGATGPQLVARQVTFAPGQTCLTLPVALVGDRSPSNVALRGVVVTAAEVAGAVSARPASLLAVREDDGGGGPLLPPETAVRTDPCGRTSAELFVDVPIGIEHHESMAWLAVTGVTTGWATPAGPEYRPTSPVNRDAMAAFLYRFAGSPAYTPPTTSPFVDVATNNLYYKEIAWLRDRGISAGWETASGREFRPFEPVRRDAMAAFLYRFAGSPAFGAPTTSPFDDVAPTAEHYREMAWLSAAGVSTGWAVDGRREYRSLQPVARDAMAAFLERLTRIP